MLISHLDWHGTKIDENIIDAALLNTTRFAHGYALSSHPLIYEMAKTRGIAVEVCPLSNQVFNLTENIFHGINISIVIKHVINSTVAF